MIDFRYHAISMVAVFLALAIGILLGVTIGDSLVSEAEQGLESSLQEDVVEARSASEDAAAALDQREQLIQDALPLIAGDRLAGRRIAIVAIGSLPEETEASVRDAIEIGGGRVDSVSVLPAPPDTERIAEIVGVSVGERRAAAGLEVLGRRIGREIVVGGEVMETLRDELPDSFDGAYRGADAVVFHRAPPAEPGPEAELFGIGVIDGLSFDGTRVVGVEASDTDPSQIPFYGRRELATVDSADLPGGRAALVLALAGADGTFGFKETAEEVLPDLPATDAIRR